MVAKLSTGQDSTLGNWRSLSASFFGEDSAATKFLDEKISIQGINEEVVTDEGQLIKFLASLHLNTKGQRDGDG